MVMKASGTKGYLSASVQKNLQATHSKRFLKEGAPVTKQQATKIMKDLKAKGLARKVTSDATAYVKKGFAQEERRQEMIKKQNVGERAKEIYAEKQAEQAKAATKSGTTVKKPVRAVTLASGQVAEKKPSAALVNDFVGNSFGSTNLKPVPLSPTLKPIAPPSQTPTKTEDDLIDLAID